MVSSLLISCTLYVHLLNDRNGFLLTHNAQYNGAVPARVHCDNIHYTRVMLCSNDGQSSSIFS